MALLLPKPSPTYDATNEAQTRTAIEREDKLNRKVGNDVEIGAQKLVLKSADGTRWSLTVENDGSLTTTSL